MHIIVYNCHTQHRTVQIISSLILLTIIIAQMMSTGGQGNTNTYTHISGHVTNEALKRTNRQTCRVWRNLVDHRTEVVLTQNPLQSCSPSPTCLTDTSTRGRLTHSPADTSSFYRPSFPDLHQLWSFSRNQTFGNELCSRYQRPETRFTLFATSC